MKTQGEIALMRSPSRRLLIGALTMTALATTWWLSTAVLGLVSSGVFPPPDEVWIAAEQIAGDGYGDATLLQHVLRSLRLVAMGFVVAVAVGVPLGLLMGWNRRAEALINPVFMLIRPIPPLAWIPLAILWLGLGDAAKIMVIFFAAFVPSVINTSTGVRNVNRTLVEAAKVHGASRWGLLVNVYLPDALPMIFTGLRLSLQASWTTLVAAELVGAFLGLGRVLISAYRDINPAMILVAMVLVAIAGALTTRVLAVVERRVIRWRPAL